MTLDVFILMFILLIIAFAMFFIVTAIINVLINRPYYIKINNELKKVADLWGCNIETKNNAYPKIIGEHNNYQISLTFFDCLKGTRNSASMRTKLQIQGKMPINAPLLIIKKIKSKSFHPQFIDVSKINFIKSEKAELDDYYSFISNNETESKNIIIEIEGLLLNQKIYFENEGALYIRKKGIKYEIVGTKTDVKYLSERLNFIEEVAGKIT